MRTQFPACRELRRCTIRFGEVVGQTFLSVRVSVFLEKGQAGMPVLRMMLTREVVGQTFLSVHSSIFLEKGQAGMPVLRCQP